MSQIEARDQDNIEKRLRALERQQSADAVRWESVRQLQEDMRSLMLRVERLTSATRFAAWLVSIGIASGGALFGLVGR